MTTKPMTRGEIRGRVSEVLMDHVGVENAIPMAALYEKVFGERIRDKINDTRHLRRVITDLRFQGRRVAEVRSRTGGGYYLARSRHEIAQFIERRKHEAIKKLKMVAALERVSLPALCGQMSLNLSPTEDGDDGRHHERPMTSCGRSERPGPGSRPSATRWIGLIREIREVHGPESQALKAEVDGLEKGLVKLMKKNKGIALRGHRPGGPGRRASSSTGSTTRSRIPKNAAAEIEHYGWTEALRWGDPTVDRGPRWRSGLRNGWPRSAQLASTTGRGVRVRDQGGGVMTARDVKKRDGNRQLTCRDCGHQGGRARNESAPQ